MEEFANIPTMTASLNFCEEQYHISVGKFALPRHVCQVGTSTLCSKKVDHQTHGGNFVKT